MTGLRTHRSLRLALVAVAVAIAASVLIQLAHDGWVPLPSLSDYYYSPAGGVFIGGLTAASVALLALSGRDAESIMLDVAAVFAPLIAIIPTGYRGRQFIPDDVLPSVRNGVGVYLVMVAALLVLAVVLAARGEVAWRRVAIVGGIAGAVSTALAVLTFVPGVSQSFPFAGGVNLHLIATVCFFAMFAAIPLTTAFGSAERTERRYRLIYLVVALVIVVAVAVTFVAAIVRPEDGGVLIGETVALTAFAVFWTTQTIERWRDADPPSILAG
ncbi:hypothetical protein [Microbacterium sp. 179-I 1D1 NHS]|uniref:hypothetical protein n=1 Tax=unclassified Microbacterium TaxID=2609290 RepID=UPI00387A77D0